MFQAYLDTTEVPMTQAYITGVSGTQSSLNFNVENKDITDLMLASSNLSIDYAGSVLASAPLTVRNLSLTKTRRASFCQGFFDVPDGNPSIIHRPLYVSTYQSTSSTTRIDCEFIPEVAVGDSVDYAGAIVPIFRYAHYVSKYTIRTEIYF